VASPVLPLSLLLLLLLHWLLLLPLPCWTSTRVANLLYATTVA
jgi:hypothetical protein